MPAHTECSWSHPVSRPGLCPHQTSIHCQPEVLSEGDFFTGALGSTSGDQKGFPYIREKSVFLLHPGLALPSGTDGGKAAFNKCCRERG